MKFITTLFQNLFQNLLGGLRTLAFFPIARHHFMPSMRQVVILGGIGGAIWMVFDRVTAGGDVQFAWPAVAQIAFIAVVFACVLLLLSPAGGTADAAEFTLTVLAATLPWFLLLTLPLSWFAHGTEAARWVELFVVVLSVAYLARIAHLILGSSMAIAAVSAVAVAGITWAVYDKSVGARPRLWRARDDAQESMQDAEEMMFLQPLLINAAVERLAPQQADSTDVYFVGFAGDGKQGVFGSEVAFARAALERKLDISERAINLINAPSQDAQTPIATGPGLSFALERVGQVMDRDEDVLLLFLTSHGTRSAKLAVYRSGWALQDLSANALATALRDSGIKWRVVIISACYSGSFLKELEDEHTLIVTAARADRQSFGCRDNRDLTYFGEALFRDALPGSNSLMDAVAKAVALVTAREQTEDFIPSEPQTFVGEKMHAKLEELTFRGACRDNDPSAAC